MNAAPQWIRVFDGHPVGPQLETNAVQTWIGSLRLHEETLPKCRWKDNTSVAPLRSADSLVCCIADCQSARQATAGDVQDAKRGSATNTPSQVGHLRHRRLGSRCYREAHPAVVEHSRVSGAVPRSAHWHCWQNLRSFQPAAARVISPRSTCRAFISRPTVAR